jgi:hypothetical protein
LDRSTDFDVVFLHPPTSFTKLEHPLGGLFEAATGTGDLLAMPPLGMLSLANELARAGRRVAVLNLAKAMQPLRHLGQAARGPLEELLGAHPARLYGIGLHWAAHASGALELAAWVKRVQPGARVLLGGLSATCFADELLRDNPEVDYVALGECDGWMPAIAAALLAERPDPSAAPNLAWREGGEVRHGRRAAPVLGAVDTLDERGLVRPAPDRARLDRDALLCNLPVVRGCSQECLFCGGSSSAYRRRYLRERHELLPVDKVLDHARRAAARGMSGIKLFGDLRLGGEGYVRELQAGLRALGPRLDLFLELFWPATRDELAAWRPLARELHLSLSPESSHPALRSQLGKSFDNRALLDLARDCEALDISAWFFFTYLLPGHTPENLASELGLLGELLRAAPSSAALSLPYLFVDPASPLYEDPARWDFTVTFDSLARIRAGLERAYWLHTIGYRTSAFDEPGLHRAILDLTLGQARLYFQTGRLCARDLLRTRQNIELHRGLGDALAAAPGLDDEAVQAEIERRFPEHLRQGSPSLLLRAFFGEPLERAAAPEALAYEAFPWALELLLGRDPGGEQRAWEGLEAFTAAHRADLPALALAATPPAPLAALFQRLFAPTGLAAAFLEALLSLEWELHRLAHAAPGEGTPRGLRLPWWMIDPLELLAALENAQDAPARQETWYRFLPATRTALALSFDPDALPAVVPRARLVRLNPLARALVRAEPAMLKVLARVLGRPAPLAPEVLLDGRDVPRAEVREALQAAGACARFHSTSSAG